MKSGIFESLFPPPRFLEVPAVGIDISDQSVKFVSLERHGGGLSVSFFGERDIPVGVVSGGQIKDKEKLTKILGEIADKYKIKEVVVALPEEESYTFRLHLPFMGHRELRESIELQTEDHIPLRASDTVFDFEVYHKPHDKHDFYDVVVYAIAKQTVLAYKEVFSNIGVSTKSFEVEAHALSRAVIPEDRDETTLIVDIGKTRSGFTTVSSGVVTFASTVGVGGNDFTTAIKKNLNVSFEEAEKLKINKAVIRTTDNSPLFFALVPVVSVLKDEVFKRYSYWNEYQGRGSGADNHSTDKIKRVILTGGQATLPGLDKYLAEGLGVNVSYGNPWENILDLDKKLPPINKKDSLRYAVAIGLAMKSFQDK